jgi:CRP/FNR family nitrogen fixation transcriptional regulator
MTVDQTAAHSDPAHGKLISVAPGLAVPGFTLRFEADGEIFAEGEPAEFIHKVISGAVRTTHLLGDGHRQIGGFHLPGEVFGLEYGKAHRFSAEAIVPCEVAFVSRRALERIAERDGDAARQLWALTSRELANLQDHVLILSRKHAAERVGAFLLKLSRQAASATVDLPMSRGDIGDHLGLTLETVSRTLGQFARDNVIALPSARRVVLHDTIALAAA